MPKLGQAPIPNFSVRLNFLVVWKRRRGSTTGDDLSFSKKRTLAMTSLFFVREVEEGGGKVFFGRRRVRWGWVEQERKNFKKINLFA